jgi:hypothetical protein
VPPELVDLDVLVVGAGMAGLATAAEIGRRVAVLEAGPDRGRRHVRSVLPGPEATRLWIERFGPYPEDGGVPLALPSVRPDFPPVFRSWLGEVLHSARYVQFNGGEPLIQDDFYELVSMLLDRPADPPLQLGVITNLNTPPARLRRLLQILPALHERHQFRLGVSFDAVGLAPSTPARA